MRLSLVLVGALAVGYLDVADGAGECRIYDSEFGKSAQVPSVPLTFCAGVIRDGTEYYVAEEDSDLNQRQLDARAENFLKDNNVLRSFMGLLPIGCQKTYKEVFCTQVFPQCGKVDPFFIQREGCEQGNNGCSVEPGLQPGSETNWDSNSCEEEGFSFIDGLCYFLFPRYAERGVCNLDNNICSATNFLAAAGLLPEVFCVGSTEVSGITFGKFPLESEPQEIAQRIKDNTGRLADIRDNPFDCSPSGGVFLNCLDVESQATLLEVGEDFEDSEIQDVFAVAPESNVCHAQLVSELNQNKELESDITNDGDCLRAKALDGIYSIPAGLGFARMPSKFDPRNNEKSNFDGLREFSNECPDLPLGTKFANTISPQCIGIDGTQGFNIRDCLLIAVQDANLGFPRFLDQECRAAFLELVCSRAQMKTERNSFCLGPNLCLDYDLPRFPSKKMCELFKDKCAGTISGSEALQALATCDITVGQLQSRDTIQCNARAQALGVTSDEANCVSDFASLAQYPESIQQFVDPDSLPASLRDAVNQQISQFQTSVVEPTLSAALYDEEPSPESLEQIQKQFCDCPRPLVAPDNINTPDIIIIPAGPVTTCCAVPCEGTMLTKDQYATFGRIMFVLTTVGVVVAIFMVATWSFFETKRAQYIPFWFMVCSLGVSLSLWVLIIKGGGDILSEACVDNSTPQSLKDLDFNTCSTSALFLLSVSTSEVSWWLVQAIDLFRKVVLGTKNTDGSKRWYHLFAWGTGLIVFVILLATEYAGFQNPNPLCSFSAEPDKFEEIAIYYAYIGIAFLAGLVMMLSVLAVIARHASNVAKAGSTAGAKFRARYRLYRTPILFVSLFVLVWLLIFLFRIIISTQEDLFQEQGAAWVNCLLTNSQLGSPDPVTSAVDVTMLEQFIPGIQPEDGCGITQPGGVPFLSVMLFAVVVYGQSIVVFFIFAAKTEVFTLWSVYLGCSEPIQSQGPFGPNQMSKGTLEFTDENAGNQRLKFPAGASEMVVSTPRQVRLENSAGFNQSFNNSRPPPAPVFGNVSGGSGYGGSFNNSSSGGQPPRPPQPPRRYEDL